MWILGISAGFAHDASATLVRDGEIVLAVEEERLDRVKYGKGFPHRSIDACLKTAGISLNDVDAVGFNLEPWRMYRADVLFNLKCLRSPKAFKYALFNLAWAVHPLLYNLKEAEKIARETNGRRPRFIDHHLCHAASAFYVSPFEDAAILTIDNRGEDVSATLSVGQGAAIRRIDEIRVPESLGSLYLGVTLFLGFKFGDEYKVMGLAPYGQPSHYDVFADVLRQEPRGRFSLNRAYFDYLGAEGLFSRKFYDALGPRRRPGEPIEQRHMDIACSLQKRLEDVVLHMADHLHRVTGADNLCLAGGVALNSVANGALARTSAFKNIFVQPAAGDAGTSMGAALAIYHHQLGRPRTRVMEHANLGPSFSDGEIEEALKACKLDYEIHDNIARTVAELLADGQIVGWFQGRMEWGPRALGARSILADPRATDVKEALNRAIKHREDFRPFAPSVLAERCRDYFECQVPSPFMLFVYNVVEGRRKEIPAVTHVDGSARIQTVRREDNALFWELIKEFEAITGVPVVLNTSFNVDGEPIVCTPRDAIRCFFGSGIDCLAIGRFLVTKSKGSSRLTSPSI